jgi:uncharacterized protein (TIGR03067 family)
MRTLLTLGLFAAAFAVASAADDKKDPTAGKWVVESVTRDGKAADALKGAAREHANGTYSITPAGGKANAGTYAIDATKNPVAIDMKPKGGTYAGKTLLGIVKVEGDTMTICFAEPGKARPAKFESAPGSSTVLAVHKKAK